MPAPLFPFTEYDIFYQNMIANAKIRMYDYVFYIYDKGKNDKKVGYLHMNIYCNPINFGYRYQFNGTQKDGVTASREAADPSMIYFKGTYYIFPSMTAGFLHSKDMVN